MVIGDRKHKSRFQSSRGSSVRRNASRRDRGRAASSIAGTKAARATFQKRLWGKCSHHKTCQRAIVLRSARRVWKARASRAVKAPADWPPPRGSRQPDRPSGRGTAWMAASPSCGNRRGRNKSSAGSSTPWRDDPVHRADSEGSSRSANGHRTGTRSCGRRGEILVDQQKKQPEVDILKQNMVHPRVLRGAVTQPEYAPREPRSSDQAL